MSTEAAQTEVTPKKSKHKKNKNETSDETKKRKRKEGDEEVDTVSDPHRERPKKKHKKHEDQDASATEPVRPEGKKHKKHKDQSAPATRPPQQVKDVLQQHSPFIQQTVSLYLPLSPCAYDFPLEGLCAEHISPLILTHYPPLKGVVLAYENPRMSENPEEGAEVYRGEEVMNEEELVNGQEVKRTLSKSIDEYAVTFVWLTAEFLLFRPKRGTYLEGYVSLQNESMLGLVCYNYFNAVIEREKLPKEWKWVEDEEEQAEHPKQVKRNNVIQGPGYFVDGDAKAVEGRLVFRVEDFEATPGSDAGAGTVSILGTLRSETDQP